MSIYRLAPAIFFFVQTKNRGLGVRRSHGAMSLDIDNSMDVASLPSFFVREGQWDPVIFMS